MNLDWRWWTWCEKYCTRAIDSSTNITITSTVPDNGYGGGRINSPGELVKVQMRRRQRLIDGEQNVDVDTDVGPNWRLLVFLVILLQGRRP